MELHNYVWNIYIIKKKVTKRPSFVVKTQYISQKRKNGKKRRERKTSIQRGKRKQTEKKIKKDREKALQKEKWMVV